MTGVPNSRNFRRTALALGLCLLAFGFAMEAKLAWYCPAGGSASDIAAAKARPADLPVVVSRGVSAPIPVHPQMLFAILAALTAASICKANALQAGYPAYARPSVSTAAYFSSSLFFRPPPVR
jgi:hypothetical protein